MVKNYKIYWRMPLIVASLGPNRWQSKVSWRDWEREDGGQEAEKFRTSSNLDRSRTFRLRTGHEGSYLPIVNRFNWNAKPQKTHYRGKYHCTTDLLVYWFGVDQTSNNVADSTVVYRDATKQSSWVQTNKLESTIPTLILLLNLVFSG